MKQNLNFNLDALIVFGKLVECRNLSKAATLLGMPKSTVSRKISKLESDLGVKLLRKNTHQITVTDIGQQVYSHSLKILAEANDVSALIEGNKQEPQGELRAALPIFMGIDYAARVGGSFLQRYPKSQLELRLVDEMVHPIKDGYDVVFGIGPLQSSTLIARKAFELDCFLCASKEFVDGLAEPLTVPSQLNKLPFIDFDYYGQPRKSTLTKGKKRYDISPMVRARVNNFQISKDYILRGLGVGIMPKQIICSGELKEGVIVPVLPEWELQSIDVYMIYPFQLSFSNLISAFYDTALEIILQNSSIP
ncbi:LysR family transcriptional regulator [Ketobacter sp. MCCC 1A13808]|uniref:LysR family transcriptional regulator n=1 Tax=Ketobacter sp. MCCC 1A13808 TaxID=2602738 RepID=UPI0012EC1642|nr:LysR family transcriptional regulator [Ketobacter sp. MCCC 1A13808]MVF14514.1 LysR family transcriptional regulator [Ketobacter sp. MCCC 1A13808]